MTLIHVHPTSTVSAKALSGGTPTHHWIELAIDNVTICIHQGSSAGKLCIGAIAQELASPMETIWCEQQAAEHDALEAAGHDESNTLSMHPEAADESCPF